MRPLSRSLLLSLFLCAAVRAADQDALVPIVPQTVDIENPLSLPVAPSAIVLSPSASATPAPGPAQIPALGPALASPSAVQAADRLPSPPEAGRPEGKRGRRLIDTLSAAQPELGKMGKSESAQAAARDFNRRAQLEGEGAPGEDSVRGPAGRMWAAGTAVLAPHRLAFSNESPAEAVAGPAARPTGLSPLEIERHIGLLGWGRLSLPIGLARWILNRVPLGTSSGSGGGFFATMRRWAAPDAASEPAVRAQVARALSASLENASARQLRLVATLMDRHPELRQEFWEPLAQSIQAEETAVPIAELPGFPRWYGGREAVLRSRMPTLWGILRDPARMSRLLFALSFLRMAQGPNGPYGMAPIEAARQDGIEFKLGEVTIVPQSGSFRRMIFRVDGEGEPFAVELKMPGDLPERKLLEPITMDVAEEILRADPQARIAKPIFMGEWSGRIEMYGRGMGFSPKKPLMAMLFDYEDGKRYSYSGGALKAFAQRWKLSPETVQELKAEALADVAWTSYLSHELGWRGQGDTHSENFRLVPAVEDGHPALRGVMVDDFEAYEKSPTVRSDWEQRSTETGLLLFFGVDDYGPALSARIMRVLERRVRARYGQAPEADRVIEALKRELRLAGATAPR